MQTPAGVLHWPIADRLLPRRLILSSILAAAAISLIFRLKKTEKRTIVIEVGMQNAAQAIAVATSPFVFGNPAIAAPAIIYALLMNVVLLVYVAFAGKH